MFAASVQLKFESLSNDDVLVDPQRKLTALSFWLNKNNYNSQQALLWCLTRTFNFSFIFGLGLGRKYSSVSQNAHTSLFSGDFKKEYFTKLQMSTGHVTFQRVASSFL